MQSKGKETSGFVSLTQEQLEKLFDECKNNVEWDGEMFTPRPLSLYRINLAKLRDAQTFRDRIVRVRYSTAVLSVPVNIPAYSDLKSSNQLVEIQNQLKSIYKFCTHYTRHYQLIEIIDEAPAVLIMERCDDL